MHPADVCEREVGPLDLGDLSSDLPAPDGVELDRLLGLALDRHRRPRTRDEILDGGVVGRELERRLGLAQRFRRVAGVEQERRQMRPERDVVRVRGDGGPDRLDYRCVDHVLEGTG